jgi:YcaO-like protein with predicted kinase domain
VCRDVTDVLTKLLGRPALKCERRGTHRSVAPRETVERVRPLLARAGITRIANVTGLDQVGLPVVQVIRPNSRSLAVSQGKGLTLDAAIASGIMESLELHHSETIDRPLRLGSHDELSRRHRLVDTERLAKPPTSRWHPGLPVLWIGGDDLVSGGPVLVPYELVDLDTRRPGSGSFAVNSNGLASGNILAEAVAHAIFELVERDSTTLWQLGGGYQQSSTRLDLASVADASCVEAISRCENAGLEVIAWDQTQDIALPTFECMLIERSASAERLMYTSSGMGCHACREVAFLRALTEAAQSRLTLIAGSRDDLLESDYDINEAAVGARRRLIAQARAAEASLRFDSIATFEGETTHEDLAHALRCLACAGLNEVIVVNLGQHDFGLPVVRVVIPGIEGCSKVPDYLPGERAVRLQVAVA